MRELETGGDVVGFHLEHGCFSPPLVSLLSYLSRPVTTAWDRRPYPERESADEKGLLNDRSGRWPAPGG
jgi:hypothetical protein